MKVRGKTIKALAVAAAVYCAVGIAPARADIAWQPLPGAVVDVGAGGNGQLWAVNAQQNIFHWVGGTWQKMPGAATRIAVDHAGSAWVVNAAGNVYQWVNNTWAQRPGTLADIAVGANNTIWGVTSTQQIYRLNGTTWVHMPGAAVRVSVDPQGNAWIVNAQNKIYSWNGGTWVERPGTARGVAVCGNGSVYTIGMDGGPYKWTGSAWEKHAGPAMMSLACDDQNRLFAAAPDQRVYTGLDVATPAAPAPGTPSPAPGTPPAPQGAAPATWVQTAGPNIPPTGTKGGQEANGEPLVLCRAAFAGGEIPGKTRKEFAGCDFAYGGKENRVPAYQVLTTALTNWVKANAPAIPAGALVAGKMANGAPLGFCRAPLQGGMQTGWVAAGLGCHIAYGGKEVTVPAYEVLMAANTGAPAAPGTPATPTPGAPASAAAEFKECLASALKRENALTAEVGRLVKIKMLDPKLAQAYPIMQKQMTEAGQAQAKNGTMAGCMALHAQIDKVAMSVHSSEPYIDACVADFNNKRKEAATKFNQLVTAKQISPWEAQTEKTLEANVGARATAANAGGVSLLECNQLQTLVAEQIKAVNAMAGN